MIEEVNASFQGNSYLIIMAIALVAGIIVCKYRRKAFFVPGTIMSVIILNPVMYEFWYRFSPYGFWRLLWILPVVPAIAMIPAFVIDEIRNNWIRLISLCAAIAVIIVGGCVVYNHVYNQAHTMFTVAKNPDKLPENVVLVGEYLLSIDEDPRVVTDASLSQYLRQYSGKIKSLYSRDVVFEGANSEVARTVYNNLSSAEGDLNYVAQMMTEYDYEYLVTRNEGREEALANAGFVLTEQIDGYGVYTVTGRNQTE